MKRSVGEDYNLRVQPQQPIAQDDARVDKGCRHFCAGVVLVQSQCFCYFLHLWWLLVVVNARGLAWAVDGRQVASLSPSPAP